MGSSTLWWRCVLALSLQFVTVLALWGAPLTDSAFAELAQEATTATGEAQRTAIVKLREAVSPDADLAQVFRVTKTLHPNSFVPLAGVLAERGAAALMPQVIGATAREECPPQFANECCKSLGTAAVPFLIEQAGAESDRVRLLVAHCLGLYLDKCPESVAPLCRLAEDKDPNVIVSALYSLRRFGCQPDVCSPILRRLLVDERPLVRLAAAAAVPRLAGPDLACVDHLLTMASDPTRPCAERQEAVGAFRFQNMQATGNLVPRLAALLDDPEPTVRKAVLDALATFRQLPEEVGRKLLGMIRATPSQPGISAALARCPEAYEEAMPLVAGQLDDPDVTVRRDAAGYFAYVARRGGGELGPKTLRALLPSLNDEDTAVRGRIIHALAAYATDPEVRDALRDQMQREPNRALKATIVSALDNKADGQ